MSSQEPWLDNKHWRDNQISSGAKYGHWAIGGFALVWNGVTLPLFWPLDDIIARIPNEPLVMTMFLFPTVGLGMLWVTWVLFKRWRKFGPTPLVLDPFPGAIGGHVGGRIDTRIPFDPSQHYAVTLSCRKSSVSGFGKNRKRSESVKWQTDGICHMEHSGAGTLLCFRFNVPEGLPVTDTDKSGTYYLWKVHVAAELEGPDFDRSFEIPVFPTGARSAIEEGTEGHAATQDLAMKGVESVADITAIPGGIEAWFPAFQRPWQGIAVMLFGLFFAGAGIGVAFASDGGIVIPLGFTLVGGLILFYGIWYLGKALMVGVTDELVRCRRLVFGYPLKTRQLPREEFVRFEINDGFRMSMGNKTTIYYQLLAMGKDGKKLRVAERLTSRAEVELLKETYETYLGA